MTKYQPTMVTIFKLLCLLAILGVSVCQNLAPFVKDMGGTLCRFLAMKAQIPRNFLRDCDHPTCAWDDWSSAQKTDSAVEPKQKQRIIVSYAHNGFGNQLWQHTVAFMVAEGMKAKLLIGIIPDYLCFDGATPPNTFAGMSAMERLLPQELLYDALPLNSTERQLCDNEPFFISDRPRDWRDRNYTTNMKSNLHDIFSDPNPRCLKMVGYFQNYPLCSEDVRNLWTPRMFTNYTRTPGPNDLSIYLRCLPRHYHFNDRHFYETILNGTSFDHIWLFQAPECPTRLGNDPSKDGLVASVLRLLTVNYNATRWPSEPDLDDTSQLLYDIAGLAKSLKLILPVSSWAFWAGMFSNATEIHVNGPPHHQVLPNMPNYIYHNEKARKFFGRYNHTTYDVEYELDNPIVA